MSVENLASAPGMPVLPETSTVATLEAVRQKLKERKVVNVATLPTFYHEGLEMQLHYGPMSNAGYATVENVAQYYPAGHKYAGQKSSDEQTDAYNRDKAYIKFGCWTADGSHLDEATVVAMLEADGFGPANRALVNKIREKNPPREYLVSEMAALIGTAQFITVFMEVAKECRLWPRVLDYITANENDPEERALMERASQKLAKIEEGLTFFAGLWEAQKAAQTLGFDLEEQVSAES